MFSLTIPLRLSRIRTYERKSRSQRFDGPSTAAAVYARAHCRAIFGPAAADNASPTAKFSTNASRKTVCSYGSWILNLLLFIQLTPTTPFETIPYSQCSRTHVAFLANDQRCYRVSINAARMSANVANILDLMVEMDGPDCLVEHVDKCMIIPLPHESCNSAAVKRVIQYCEYHCEDPQVEPRDSVLEEHEDDDYDVDHARKLELPTYWDRHFIAIKDRGEFYDLLLAAHYLQIPGIIEVGGKFICRNLANKTDIEAIRLWLNITEPYTQG